MFLFSKSADYYYDVDAIREPFADAHQGRDGSKKKSQRNRGGRTDGYTKPNGIDPSANGGRNKRSVWLISAQPYSGAHFATMPEALVEPCVLAGAPIGGITLEPFCGKWHRVERRAPPRAGIVRNRIEPGIHRTRACPGAR